MRVTQAVTLYSKCNHWTAADVATTLGVAYQHSHGHRDNPIAIPLPVAVRAAGGVYSQIPDNQTTHTAPFDTVAHINWISQVVLQNTSIPAVYRSISENWASGLTTSHCGHTSTGPQSSQRCARCLCIARNGLTSQHAQFGHISRNQRRGRHVEIRIARVEASDWIGQ